MNRLCAISILILLLFAPLTLPAQPEGVRVSTWVREDLFAGFLADDQESLQAGIKKLDAILAGQPDNAGALAWRASIDYYRAVRAHEQGDRAKFERLYQQSMDAFRNLYETAPQDISVLAVTSGATSLFAGRFPEPQRTESFQLSRDRFEALARAQSEFFDKMPAHHRGEVLAGLAQAEEHLGNRARSREHLTRIVNTLGGTPYELPARKWLDDPGASGGTRITCLSCHEPGRLENAASRKP